MRKITVILVALLFLCGINTLTFAYPGKKPNPPVKKSEVKTEVVIGKVISIDAAKNEVKLKTKGGKERTITVNPRMIHFLKVDEEVKITVKAGSNVAMKISKIVHKTHQQEKK
jgi:hypothetical protein